MYGFMFALVILLAGFLGDWLGRKWTIVVSGLLSLVLFGFFTFSANNGWNPYVIGAFYGLYLGCFWQGGDYFMMLSAEKAPTGVRSSVFAAGMFLMMFVAMIGNFFMAAALRMTSISSAVLILSVPAIVISVLLVIFKVKETKGVDLTKVGSEEA
jgi:MFS family permease